MTAMSDFKKLDDLPKGRPHTYDEVMKAMGVLHKLILAQSHAYGGKHSKYIPAQVVETSLLKAVHKSLEPIHEDETDRLLDVTHDKAEALAKHLKDTDDGKGLAMLGQLLKMLGIAMGAKDDKK